MNVSNIITVGKIAKKSDIPTNVSELTNDSKYQTETGVTTIINGTVTADYVNGLSCNFTKGKIGGWTISSNEFYSDSAGVSSSDDYTKASLVTSGSTSPVRFYCGNGNRIDGKFVVLDDGSLYASAANISGNITATSGTFNGTIVSSNATITGGSLTITSSATKQVRIQSGGLYISGGKPSSSSASSYKLPIVQFTTYNETGAKYSECRLYVLMKAKPQGSGTLAAYEYYPAELGVEELYTYSSGGGIIL